MSNRHQPAASCIISNNYSARQKCCPPTTLHIYTYIYGFLSFLCENTKLQQVNNFEELKRRIKHDLLIFFHLYQRSLLLRVVVVCWSLIIFDVFSKLFSFQALFQGLLLPAPVCFAELLNLVSFCLLSIMTKEKKLKL